MSIDLKQYFDDYTIYKGFEYYHSGNIKDIKRLNNQLTARITGSKEYIVHIDLDNMNNMTCTCPQYAKGNKCKHLSALLHAYNNENIEEKEEYDLDQMIDLVDEEFLRFFLKIQLRNNKELQQELLDVIPSIYIIKKKGKK